MLSAFRIVGYAIASADGMIADANGVMPESLKNDADHRYLDHALDHVEALIHGRRSHEAQANSHRRRRLVLTRAVHGIVDHPELAKSRLWNPAGASLEVACKALDVKSGTIAVLGGTDVYDMFLEIGYDAFHLSRAGNAFIPGGTPVFAAVLAGRTPEEVLAEAGLEASATRVLDASQAVTVTSWTRRRG
jgi:dihydrofolate reductase